MRILRVILWDHLTLGISSLQNINKKNDTILFCEVREECTYVKHHKKKLVFLLSAMRHFANELKSLGYNICYVKLNDTDNTQTLSSEITRIAKKLAIKKILITWPGEYRIYESLLNLNIEILEDDRFLSSRAHFAYWAGDKKSLRMEFFYRHMRQKHNILMNNDIPEGGQWNYDAENRHFPKEKINIPETFHSKIDDITQEVINLIQKEFSDHFGDILPFHYAVNQKEAEKAFKQFVKERLPHFGDYQDVMMQDKPWLFHSHISFYMNVGLLSPLKCIKAVEKAYQRGDVPLASAEGFIRQILGWREFVHGVYWLKMPDYKLENYLQAKRRLPNFYWTTDTKMNCIKQCVTETRANAYAHHIQRLMVLGNFALLTSIDPSEVNEWYLIVYADAHEWVELPNVTGMILFADGGYLASKPYAASGAYINKMSDYCQNCQYKVKEKNGPDACPFNYLYWNFLLENKSKLRNNQRLSMIYSSLSRIDPQKITQIQKDAKTFLASLTHEW